VFARDEQQYLQDINMNDKMKFPFWNTDWMNNNWTDSQPDWFQNQNQYMDAWSSFQKFMPNSSSGIPPMAEAMNSWWKSASPSLSGQHQDFYSKLMQQGQAFYIMGEQLSKFLEGMNEVNSQSEEWQTVLNDQFESMKSMLAGANANILSAFTSMSSMAGELNNDFLEVAGMTSFVDKLLSMPGVGPDRETQAQMQKGIKLFNEYQQVSNEYNAKMSKVGVEALQALRLRILEMAEQGGEINSLREIYDLWIDCNEKAYAECVYTDEYSELYGRLTNALLAVKQHNGKVMGQLLTKFNIPTRQGMNTVLKRLQEMKRAQAKSTAKIEAMEKEVRVLRKLIEDGKKSSSTTNQRSTNIRKARKKASKKESKKKSTKKTSNKKPIVIDI
jgi:class III poly(R)-hydroxyalkanoic acid synthase PhaE subunit